MQCFILHVTTVLDPNSTTRTPARDMLYNTTNGQAHNNSTTCCTTNSPPTDKILPHPNILTCRDVAKAQQSCTIESNENFCKRPIHTTDYRAISEHIYRMITRRCTTNLAGYGHVVQHLQLVVSLAVGGVVQHVRSRCPCSGVWHLLSAR